MKKSQKVAVGICGSIWLLLAILGMFVLSPVLEWYIPKSIAMTQQTYNLWGQNPGDTGTQTIRNFTIYNFTNPRQYLYRNATPVFTQMSGYVYQQLFNFTNYQYSQDRSEISFNYWLHFNTVQSSNNYDDKVWVLNAAPLGFWSQLDIIDISSFALQGFGGLFVQMNKTIKIQAIGQGVAGLFANNDTIGLLCFQWGISVDKCRLLWQDPHYGLSGPQNYEPWIQAWYRNNEQAQQFLIEYFCLSRYQIEHMRSQFKEWSETVNKILNNWYCKGRQCSGYELTLIQISSGGVTLFPPIGDPIESICSQPGNITCMGQPQITTYLHNTFREKYPQQKYQKLNFSLQSFRQLLSPYNGTLLNIGNITQFYGVGKRYEEQLDPQLKEEYLSQLRALTYSETNDHAFVVWKWVHYFTEEFVLKLAKGGSRKNSGLGGIFASALYQSFSDFGQWITQYMVTLLATETITNCYSYLQKTYPEYKKQTIEKLCTNLTDPMSLWKLFEPCLLSTNKLQAFRKNYLMTPLQLQDYCSEQQDSIYTLYKQINQKIWSHYGCRMNLVDKKCSKYQLGLIQWISSNITMNPIKTNSATYQKSLSVHSWNNQLPEFQYRPFMMVYYGQQLDQEDHNNLSQLSDLLSFDKLFSAPMVMEMLLFNQSEFSKLFYWSNMTYLKDYVRYITIEVGFGGLVIQKAVKQIIFGYEDKFLQTLKQMDPILGGDPSIQTLVAFNQPNITQSQAIIYPQSMNSGINDPSKIREYISVYNKSIIAINKTWYDGYQIHSQFVNPYQQEVPIIGTDALQNSPNLQQDGKLYFFIANLYRIGIVDFNETRNKFGMKVYNYVLDKEVLASYEQCPSNQKYYQTFSGFINMSYIGLPIFTSRNHFYLAPQNWSKLVVIQDRNHNLQQGNQWDNTYIEVQPNTGATFTAVIYIQTNYYYKPDILFKPQRRMLPMLSLYRSGNITQQSVDNLLGDLKFVLNLKIFLVQMGIIICVLLLISACICHMKNTDQNQKRSSLLASS